MPRKITWRHSVILSPKPRVTSWSLRYATPRSISSYHTKWHYVAHNDTTRRYAVSVAQAARMDKLAFTAAGIYREFWMLRYRVIFVKRQSPISVLVSSVAFGDALPFYSPNPLFLSIAQQYRFNNAWLELPRLLHECVIPLQPSPDSAPPFVNYAYCVIP